MPSLLLRARVHAALLAALALPVTIPRSHETRVRFDDVRVSTGVRLHVAEKGRAGGRAIVFLHGYSDSWASWSRVLAQLPDSIHAIAIDQRGHGDSERPATGYAMRDLARDAVALMDAKGIRSATIVGHSMGSLVAQQVAVIAPGRVEALVLVGGGRSLRHFTGIDDMDEALAGMTRARGSEASVPATFARAFQESTVRVSVPRAFMDSAVSASLRLPLRVWSALWDGMISTGPATELRGARLPVLLMHGRYDAYASLAEQDSLRAMYPRATLRRYEELGHAPHWEAPALVTADLMNWLAARR